MESSGGFVWNRIMRDVSAAEAVRGSRHDVELIRGVYSIGYAVSPW